MEKITLNVAEVAKMLGVSRATVYTMVREDEIKYFKVRSSILFNREVIEAFTRGEVEAPNEAANA